MNIFKGIEIFSDIYCQSKNMADFRVLQRKLEPRFTIVCCQAGKVLKLPPFMKVLCPVCM